MEYLNCPFVETKAADEQDGTITGYGSVFDVLDLQGDVVCRGSFSRTIKENPSGWPMLHSHQMGRPVGFWTHAREDRKGLFLRGEFTLDTPDGAAAAAFCRHAQKLNQPFGLSIGYRPFPGGVKDEGGIRKLLAIDLVEVSLAATPACLPARVVSVKAEDEGPDLRKMLHEGLGWSQAHIDQAHRRHKAHLDLAIREALREELGYSEAQISRGLRLPSEEAQVLRKAVRGRYGFSEEEIDGFLLPPPPDSVVEASAADIAKAFRDANFRVARRREYLAKLLDPPRPPRAQWMGDCSFSDQMYDQNRDERVKDVEDAIVKCKNAGEVASVLYTMGFKDQHVGYMQKAGLCDP